MLKISELTKEGIEKLTHEYYPDTAFMLMTANEIVEKCVYAADSGLKAVDYTRLEIVKPVIYAMWVYSGQIEFNKGDDIANFNDIMRSGLYDTFRNDLGYEQFEKFVRLQADLAERDGSVERVLAEFLKLTTEKVKSIGDLTEKALKDSDKVNTAIDTVTDWVMKLITKGTAKDLLN